MDIQPEMKHKDMSVYKNLYEKLSSYFETSHIEAIGKSEGFIERSSSRLSSWMFFVLNTCMIDAESSLTDMVGDLASRYGVKMAKQSLDERFNMFSVKFMFRCFEDIFQRLLHSEVSSDSSKCIFSRIVLRDSTSFQLPAEFSPFYKGNAGSTTGSVIKIQQEIDLLSGKIMRLDLRDGVETDTEWLNRKGLDIEKNDLHLMDLGYFKYDALERISKSGGYFISRYKVGIPLYQKEDNGTYQVLDWQDILAQVDKKEYEQLVYIGNGKEKNLVRIYLSTIPIAEVEKRLLKHERKEKNQSKNRRPYKNSPIKKQLAHYNIFITNASESQLATSLIYPVYKLRWQIELLFKVWKSLFEIDKIQKMNIFRFQCYLYGKLIAILISGHLQQVFIDFLKDMPAFELSEWKAHKLIKKN